MKRIESHNSRKTQCLTNKANHLDPSLGVFLPFPIGDFGLPFRRRLPAKSSGDPYHFVDGGYQEASLQTQGSGRPSAAASCGLSRTFTELVMIRHILQNFHINYNKSDSAAYQQHQKLEKLYISTRAAKHFQRDIVRGVEGYIITGSKQFDIGNKLSEDSRKYGAENTCTSGNTLSKAALCYARARAQMENERANLSRALGTQVAEPLRAMVMGAPLEDARHLAQRYDRVRQEAEAQAIEVSKRQIKVRESAAGGDYISKLEAAEAKLEELKSSMAVLGKEAVAAMTAVEAQQQRLTLQRLIAMVELERTFHQKSLQILEQLETEMLSERQRIEASPSPAAENYMPPPPSYEEANDIFVDSTSDASTENVKFFLAEAIQSYLAETEVELNLSAGDYVVVRKISNNGWAEGECKGKAGWFPFAYIERRERVLASNVIPNL